MHEFTGRGPDDPPEEATQTVTTESEREAVDGQRMAEIAADPSYRTADITEPE